MPTCSWSYKKQAAQELNWSDQWVTSWGADLSPSPCVERTLKYAFGRATSVHHDTIFLFPEELNHLEQGSRRTHLIPNPRSIPASVREDLFQACRDVPNHRYSLCIFSCSTSIHHHPFITFLKIQSEQYCICSLSHSLLMSQEKLKQTSQKSLET